MSETKSVGGETKKVRISSLEDLINLNLRTLEDVVNGDIDNRKAALMFTGSRTVAGSLKLALEAVKLGMGRLAGIDIGDSKRAIPQLTGNEREENDA